MKLACASGLFHRAIESGEITQLEFLDLCAREFACDGAVLDVRHFPRTDGDYLAQIKKMATDCGLCLAALADPRFFLSDAQRMESVLERAVMLGAPLVAAPLGCETECSWSDQLERLGVATSLAKRLNVTLAVRNAPATFAGSTSDCKRVAKETDSAWLRFGPQPGTFEAADDLQALRGSTVLLWVDAGEEQRSMAATLAALADFRGHLALDAAGGDATVDAVASATRFLRRALDRV